MTAQNVGAALEKLVAFTSKIEWDDIPQAVKTRAAFVLADDIGAMVAARAEPELIALQNGVAASAGPPEATLFNAMGTRLDRYSAALANGCASDWAELDEGYRRVICHAGIYCLPALLAEAEAEDHTTADLLRASTWLRNRGPRGAVFHLSQPCVAPAWVTCCGWRCGGALRVAAFA